MTKFEKHYIPKKDKFYLIAGRVVCRNEKELFAVKLLEEESGPRYNISPVEADALAHFIVDKLNNGKAWGKYLDEYMKV